jgi:predicted RNA-binding Zn-ribbon protein involved in translation (DUF1610 family)
MSASSIPSSPTNAAPSSPWSPTSSTTSLSHDDSNVIQDNYATIKLTEFVCPHCHKIQTKRNKARHMAIQHPEIYTVQTSTKEEKGCECPNCGKHFTRPDTCDRHIRNGVCKATLEVVKKRMAIKAQNKQSRKPGRRGSKSSRQSPRTGLVAAEQTNQSALQDPVDRQSSQSLSSSASSPPPTADPVPSLEELARALAEFNAFAVSAGHSPIDFSSAQDFELPFFNLDAASSDSQVGSSDVSSSPQSFPSSLHSSFEDCGNASLQLCNALAFDVADPSLWTAQVPQLFSNQAYQPECNSQSQGSAPHLVADSAPNGASGVSDTYITTWLMSLLEQDLSQTTLGDYDLPCDFVMEGSTSGLAQQYSFGPTTLS